MSLRVYVPPCVSLHVYIPPCICPSVYCTCPLLSLSCACSLMCMSSMCVCLSVYMSHPGAYLFHVYAPSGACPPCVCPSVSMSPLYACFLRMHVTYVAVCVSHSISLCIISEPIQILHVTIWYVVVKNTSNFKQACRSGSTNNWKYLRVWLGLPQGVNVAKKGVNVAKTGVNLAAPLESRYFATIYLSFYVADTVATQCYLSYPLLCHRHALELLVST